MPDGGVFGFLGPNGSGKTTTIRCLLALARPSAGECRVLGVDSHTALPQVIAQIGSMVETPGLFPAMSGRKNLALDVSDAEIAARRQAIDAEVASCVAGGPITLREGREGPPPDVPRTENFCRFVAGGVDDPRFELRSLKGILQGTTAPLVVVAWLIGASVIGSDWQSRTMTTVSRGSPAASGSS